MNISAPPVGAVYGRRAGDGSHRPPLQQSPLAFTLIELLCVLAIVGVLAALVFPSVGAARGAAGKARVRTEFAQWAAAIESFRGEYGYFPAFDASNLVNGGVTATDHPFHDVLAGKRRDGTPLATDSPAARQNRKGIAFYSFSEANLGRTGLIHDAIERTDMAVLVDRDLDGFIRQGADFTELPAVDGMTPGSADFPATGVRAGVVFYAAAPGATPANPGFICSWK